jgi:inorganic triphosphatase YgiF
MEVNVLFTGRVQAQRQSSHASAGRDRRSAPPAEPVGCHAMELELKFDLDDPRTERLLATEKTLGAFTLGQPRTLRVTDRYLDTQARDCWQHGYSCRLRISERKTMLTLKGERQPAETESPATFRREEISQLLPLATADISAWPRGVVRDLVLRFCHGQALHELLTLQQERIARAVLAHGRQAGILTVDRVMPIAGSRTLPTYGVIEFELGPDGSQHDLVEFASMVRPLSGLKPSTCSKFLRGLTEAAAAEH